jgi:hypothetical protein
MAGLVVGVAVGWLLRRHKLRGVLAVLAALLAAATVGWGSRRYPPPAWQFDGADSHAVVLVVISDAAPRRPDRTLSFAASCAVLLHPDDFDAARSEGPWSTYPGVFPLVQTDHARTAGAQALAFATDGSGPSALQGAQVFERIDQCGGEAVQAVWSPQVVEVRGGDRVWLVQPLPPSGTQPTVRSVDAGRGCAAPAPGVHLGAVQVRFVDAAGQSLADRQVGLAGIVFSEHAVAAHFMALPEDLPVDRLVDVLDGVDDTWQRCLEATPSLAPVWLGP